MSKSEKMHFFDKPKNIQLILRVFYALCAALVVADFIIHRHEMHPWDHLPTFYPLFGFVACVLLVLVAVQMRKVLMRDEDYYEKGEKHDVD